jgi:3-oxoacyl-[acyl-carrier protein] reductase
VNDVAPAMIEETGMIPSDEAIGGYAHKIPLQRFYLIGLADCRLGKTEEVADAVVIFVTCGYITGQSLLMYFPSPQF